MVSNNISFGDDSSARGDSADSLYASTQKAKSLGKYGEYLLHESEPGVHFNNSQNLFDDSNRENQKWLRRAKVYLARVR